MSINNHCEFLRLHVENKAESEFIEYKHDNNDPDMIGQTVSALANSAFIAGKSRAFFIFGVDDQTRQLVGTSVKIKSMRKGNQDFQQWLEQMMKPRLPIEFHEFDCEGKHFGIIEIHTNLTQPVAFSGTKYIRINSAVKKLNEFPEHERKIWQAASHTAFETGTAKSHASLETVEALLDLETYFSLSQTPAPASKSELIRHLIAHDIISDNLEGKFDISNLGAILLAKDLSNFKDLASNKIRMVTHRGRGKTHVIADRELSSGYVVEFQEALALTKAFAPSQEIYEHGVRRVQTIPETAIREVLANALIHQDFSVNGIAPMIEIFEDRIEISNPGKPLIEPRRMINERRSRNVKLAGMMRALRLCEERGGGLDKTFHEIETVRLPAPELYASDTAMRVIMQGPKSFAEMNKKERIWSAFVHCTLLHISNQAMSNTTLRERFNLPKDEYQAISIVIRDAIHAGYIAPADTGQGKKNARYIPFFAVSS
jgi:predicted HTH transcriptional regulator